MMCKKIAVLSLAFVTLLSVAVCGTKTTENPATAAPKTDAPITAVAPAEEGAKDVQITVFHYMGQITMRSGLDEVEATFVAENPEYNITWENIMNNQDIDHFHQLQTALVSGNQSAISISNPGLYLDLVEQCYVANMTGNEVINGLDLSSGDLSDVSANGHIYGFPIDFKIWCVF